MAMNYEKVDPQAVGFDVMRQRAQETEGRAFQAAAELQFLEIEHHKEPGNGELAQAYFVGQRDTPKLRRAADRARGAAPLNEEELDQVHRQALSSWLEGIEHLHAQTAAMRNECQRLLELEGDTALDLDERGDVAADLERNIRRLTHLERAHAFCKALRSDEPDAPEESNGQVDPEALAAMEL